MREWSDEPMTRFQFWGYYIGPFDFLVINWQIKNQEALQVRKLIMPLEVLIILFCGRWLLCILQLIAPIVWNDHRRVERSELLNRIGWRGGSILVLRCLARAAARNTESRRQHYRCRQLHRFSFIATHRANSFALPREVRSVCRSSARSAWLWLLYG